MATFDSHSRADEFRGRLHSIASSYLEGRETLEASATRFAGVWEEWVQAAGVGTDVTWFWPDPSRDEAKRLEVLLAAALEKRS
jgi:hypothetical protein